MTRTVHQLVHTLSYGDAISGEVLALRRCLRERGLQSDIFAINTHPHYSGETIPFGEFPSGFDGEVVLHYSLGSPLSNLYESCTGAKRTLIFHNLTPSRWFSGVNPRIVADIERGREELPRLCRCSTRCLADSAFNAQELSAHGVSAEVLPLPIDPQRWASGPNQGFADLLRGDNGVHLLHVGRLAPNKCVEDIIKVFYYLHHHVIYPRRSTLWLVGIDIDTELYSFALRRMTRELALDAAVRFVGSRADGELQSLYENSTAYLCMSEHEGFCVPLIEAMHFGLPVLAYASSAVPDTMGNAGILLHEKRHAEIAELIGTIAEDPQLRSRLVAAGKERVASLSYEKFSERVGALFA